MRPDEFARIKSLEDTHWWYKGRRGLLHRLIKHLQIKDAMILDAGCGTGFAGRELCSIGTVIGLDSSPDAFAYNSSASSIQCLAHIDNIPFPDNTFDLIVAMDLIEHLDDDATALKEMYRVCKDNGYIFITVPAYRWMWSSHDEALGHKRRYTLGEVRNKLRKAGFSIEKSSYFVSSVFPLVFLYRMLRRKSTGESASSDLSPLPEPFNSILAFIMRIESGIAWYVGLPLGLTAFVLAKKIPESEVNG
ncbi:MAG: class I SAM-dependent methyltransferase [Armatimonadota bacterium]